MLCHFLGKDKILKCVVDEMSLHDLQGIEEAKNVLGDALREVGRPHTSRRIAG